MHWILTLYHIILPYFTKSMHIFFVYMHFFTFYFSNEKKKGRGSGARVGRITKNKEFFFRPYRASVESSFLCACCTLSGPYLSRKVPGCIPVGFTALSDLGCRKGIHLWMQIPTCGGYLQFCGWWWYSSRVLDITYLNAWWYYNVTIREITPP